MTKTEVVEIVKKSLVKILIIDRNTNSVKSQGSGVVINNLGFILTAYHVVSSIKEDNSRVAIAIPYKDGGSPIYQMMFGGMSFNIPNQNYLKPAIIDLAILMPQQSVSLTPISMAQEIPAEGTEVIMAGFPEDLKPPLDFTRGFNNDAFVNKSDVERIKMISRAFIPWIMVKHGIIGGVGQLYLENLTSQLLGPSVSFAIHGAEYWIDNTYARGASGGPVVDMEGRLLGIITERGESYESDLSETIIFPVPSGTVRILSQELIVWSLQELEKRWKSINLAKNDK